MSMAVVTSGADDGGAGTFRSVLAAVGSGGTIVFDKGLAQIAIGANLTTPVAVVIDGAQGRAGAPDIAVAIAAGATWQVNGTGDSLVHLGIGGSGTFAIGGGATTLGPAVSLGMAAFMVTGAGTRVSLAAPLAYAGTFSQQLGTTLTLTGGSLSLYAGASFIGATVNGSQKLLARGTTTVKGLTIGGTAVFQTGGTTTQSGGTVTVGDAAGNAATLIVGVGGTYTITDASGIGRGTSAASTIQNRGLFQKTSATGVSIIAASMVDTGTLGNAGGNLVFDGPSNSFTGTFTGPGMLDYGPDGVHTVGTLSMIAGACSTALGAVTQTGQVTVADGTTVRTFVGATWTLQGDVGIQLAPGSTSPSFTNFGGFAKGSGTGTSTLGLNMTSSGTVTVAAGTLAFAGASNSVSGSLVGSGTVAFAGGSTLLDVGSVLGTAGLNVSGSGTAVTVGTALTYAGAFKQTAGSTLSLTGGPLHLSGASSFTGATITGSQHLYADGPTTIAGGLTIGGTAVFESTRTVTQSAGAVTVGDALGNAGLLAVDAGAVYAITDNSGIARGAGGGSSLLVQGVLRKTGGTGTSTIAPDIGTGSGGTGTVAVAAGTLDLGGALTGSLHLDVGTGTTLILDKTASAGTVAAFSGSNGTLQLNDAQDYLGSIAGFGPSQTLDLRSLSFGPDMVSNVGFARAMNGGTLTLSDGTNTASLLLTGRQYARDDFHICPDAQGGTAIIFV